MTRLVPLLLSALLLAACVDRQPDDGDGDNGQADVAIEPDVNRITLWRLGDSVDINVVVYDVNGAVLDPPPPLEWVSSNEAVVSIEQPGRITALGEGEAVVTVSGKGGMAQITVIVNTQLTTISGTVRYQDRIYSGGGFIAEDDYNPVRYAEIDILDAFGRLVTSGRTDGQGRYQFAGLPSERYFLRVLSKAGGAYPVEIQDLTGDLYAVKTELDTSDPARADVSIDLASGLAGVFNMLDVMVTGMEFFASLGAGAMPPLSVYWQRNNTLGTYFCTGYGRWSCPRGLGIYIYDDPSYAGDTDLFDDDVLWHEFGHFIAAQLADDDSMGGCHLLESRNLDLRLAWSEGWGNFLPGAIKHWLRADPGRRIRLSQPPDQPVTLYVDTAGSRARISADMNDANWSSYERSVFRHASNEVAVANILWQLSGEFGVEKIWAVMTDYFPGLSTPISLESFWDGWLSVHAPNAAAKARLRQILRSRQVFYELDNYEPDDTVPAGRYDFSGDGEQHHLYREDNADLDVVVFNVEAGRRYRVETLDLRNGADTFLRVLDDQGQTIAANDDLDENFYGSGRPCGEELRFGSLASRVEFTASRSALFQAHISTTVDPDPYPEAGRYGSYRLKITPQ